MKIEKMKSGSYRIRKTYNKKTYSVVVDYKPTQKEAMKLMAAEFDKTQSAKARITFLDAALDYIDLKDNVLSPSTIKNYYSIANNFSSRFKNYRISDITSLEVQKELNDYSKTHAPKSVRNASGFITAVLKVFCPNTIIRTTIPQKPRQEAYIPSDDDVRAILSESKGTEYEIPLILATFGLRRSEVCALSIDDLNGNALTINKALVQNVDKEWVIKTTKTAESTRTIYLPDEVCNMIREQGYIYKGHPGNIIRHLQRTQEKLGIPKFSLHKLRHYYASVAHSLGVPDSYIMKAGGWKTDSTLKNVYRHAMADKEEEMQKFTSEYLMSVIH